MPQVARLLVVEDDRRVGSFIARGLRDEGFAVEWVVTGTEALARATPGAFDLVVLDHMLPGHSGIDVTRRLRAGGHTMPILMLTARDAPEDQRAAFEAGANALIGKPFHFEELLRQIRSMLGVLLGA